MYWALTMVMKSPWLPPGTTSEQAFSSATVTCNAHVTVMTLTSPPCNRQAFSSATVVLGAIVFASFLGMVTTMIGSYDKGQVLRNGRNGCNGSYDKGQVRRRQRRGDTRLSMIPTTISRSRCVPGAPSTQKCPRNVPGAPSQLACGVARRARCGLFQSSR